MKKLAFFIVLSLLFVHTGCIGEIGKSGPEGIVEIRLLNHSDENLQMWIAGEQIGQFNEVIPGSERTASYAKSAEFMAGKIKEESVAVLVGRNGLGIAQKTLTMTMGFNEYIVGYDGSGFTHF